MLMKKSLTYLLLSWIGQHSSTIFKSFTIPANANEGEWDIGKIVLSRYLQIQILDSFSSFFGKVVYISVAQLDHLKYIINNSTVYILQKIV